MMRKLFMLLVLTGCTVFTGETQTTEAAHPWGRRGHSPYGYSRGYHRSPYFGSGYQYYGRPRGGFNYYSPNFSISVGRSYYPTRGFYGQRYYGNYYGRNYCY